MADSVIVWDGSITVISEIDKAKTNPFTKRKLAQRARRPTKCGKQKQSVILCFQLLKTKRNEEYVQSDHCFHCFHCFLMFSHVFTVSLCLKINHNEITILTVIKCFSDFTIFTALQCYAVPCIVFTVSTGFTVFTVFTVSTIVTVFSVSLPESTVDPVRRVFPL